MPVTLIPHRRQFVIDRKRHAFGADWQALDLPDGFVLSHHADLRIAPAAEGGLLLGAAYAGSGRGGPAGRFVRVAWPYLETDAAALLSIYHVAGPDGPMASSSPALLARLEPSRPRIGRRMRWGGLNWVPGPGSPLEGVRKLLPGQRLHVPDGAVTHGGTGLRPAGSVDEARATLAEELTATVGQAADGAGTTYLALTGGFDSRTLLATLLAAGARFEVVTQVVRNPADVRVAAEICRHLGVRHHVIGPRPRDESRRAAWTDHAQGLSRDADDTLLIPRDQYRFLDPDAVLLRGNSFGIGRYFYESVLRGLSFENATGEALWRRLERDRAPDAATVRFLDEWLEVRRAQDNGLDLVDAFFLDQRLGGWLAALEQGLDLLPGTSVQPASSARAMGALLTPPLEERATKALQKAVIRDLEPALLRFPVNPESVLDQAARMARNRAAPAVRLLRRLLGGAKQRLARG